MRELILGIKKGLARLTAYCILRSPRASTTAPSRVAQASRMWRRGVPNFRIAMTAMKPMAEILLSEPRSRKYVYIISLIAAAGGFNWGFDIILMSGAILYIKS